MHIVGVPEGKEREKRKERMTKISSDLIRDMVAHTVKNRPAGWETWVRSLGQEDPLKKGMATHSSILAWRIPWTEGPSGLLFVGLQSCTGLSDLHFHFHFMNTNIQEAQ